MNKTKKKSINKTKKQPVVGIAVFNGEINGIIRLTEINKGIRIELKLSGLPKNKLLGFHCHEAGDLTEQCHSCCSHFNPTNKSHGDLNHINSHVGDFGNIQTDDNGNCNQTLISKYAKLRGKHSIMGRSLVIHKEMDDLGLTDHPDSKITGNSGARIACSIIGYSRDSLLYLD